MRDQYGRQFKDLRIAVTDRCNYKCWYCKSQQGKTPLVFRNGIMQYEEIIYLAKIFVELGIEKIRITGGEPLLRRQLEKLIAGLSQLPLKDLALTTNGFRLAEKAQALREAGLNRVTVSLDTLDPDKFEKITGSRSLDRVLRGLEVASQVGLAPVKVNVVLIRGFNDDEIQRFGEFARNYGYIVRFIEFMPLDEDKNWSRSKIVPERYIFSELEKIKPLKPVETAPSSTSRRFRFSDGIGEIGVISSISSPFCSSCTRLRLTADGKLRTCLFSIFDYDLLSKVREGIDEGQLKEYIKKIAFFKESGHQIGKKNFVQPMRNMSLIGG